MITRSDPAWHTEDWQRQLQESVRSVDELWQMLALPPAALEGARAAAGDFALKIPRSYIAKMTRGDLDDPLLRQVVARGEELLPAPGYSHDPLKEADANPHPGLLHKYASRVLVVAGSACAVNCRYCFRRHFPYEDNAFTQAQLDTLIRYLHEHREVNEVIFSGGDPLVTSNQRIKHWLDALDAVPTLTRVRFHTRTPIVIPERIDSGFLQLMEPGRLSRIMVLHANHPREIDARFQQAMQPLKQRGVTLLNQSVLLKGVNDDVGVLVALSEALFATGVLPYYLHLLDRVSGAGHFAIDDDQAYELHRQLAARLPGFLLPRLVREEAGRPAKTVIAPAP